MAIEGVVSLEDIDKAMWAGPGLRWAAMGPTTLFHLGAGEGGLQAFCDHFKDTFNGWWDDLGDPRRKCRGRARQSYLSNETGCLRRCSR